MKIERNVGKVDVIIRMVAGLPLSVWGIYAGSWWAVLGIILIVTGLMRHCTVYSLLGISTVRKKRE